MPFSASSCAAAAAFADSAVSFSGSPPCRRRRRFPPFLPQYSGCLGRFPPLRALFRPIFSPQSRLASLMAAATRRASEGSDSAPARHWPPSFRGLPPQPDFASADWTRGRHVGKPPAIGWSRKTKGAEPRDGGIKRREAGPSVFDARWRRSRCGGREEGRAKGKTREARRVSWHERRLRSERHLEGRWRDRKGKSEKGRGCFFCVLFTRVWLMLICIYIDVL